VPPQAVTAWPLLRSLDAGCAGFYAGARHGVARGGTCAAPGGGGLAVAALARRGLRRLLSWRASRVWCRAAHVLAQVAAAWPLLRSLGAGCVGFQDTADTQQHRTCHSACSQHQTCLGMQLSIRHASACSQHQTCLGMQLSVRCATRHAAQRQTCHSACSPASDVPLGMQPSVRRATRHAAQRQTCHSACSLRQTSMWPS
jgi:hypothetical protein